MIFLNKEDIMSIISYKEMMMVIEEAYRAFANNEYSMPLRVSEEMGEDTLLLMPCVNNKGFGTKILSLIPRNIEKGKPYIDGVMVLHEAEFGQIVAIMDAKILTALRTGAVGGVAMKYLSPYDANSVGIIGCGMQGFYQAIYASNIRELKRMQIFDQRTEILQDFAKLLAKEINYIVDINICNNVEELVQDSEIIVTTTTATSPVIPNDANLVKNKCFIGIGSYKPNMREFPEEVFKQCEKIFIDTDHALEESGDLITPLNQGWITDDGIGLFSNVIQSKNNFKYNTVLFKSVGMALFDLFAAQKIFEMARKNNTGQKIVF